MSSSLMSSPLMYHHLLCLHSLCPHLSCFSQVLKKGVFHPMTMSGNLVVDGVLVSIFTDLVPVVASAYHSSHLHLKTVHREEAGR